MPISKLQEELKQGAMMVGVGVMLGTGRAAVMTQEVVDVIEVRADKLAASWVTVAQSDARVAEALARLVSGGAWVNAITSTVAFGVTLGTFSGTVRIPIGLATTLVPELRPFTVAPVVPQPPQGPMNGEVPDGSEGP
jgi:hypothetical protein